MQNDIERYQRDFYVKASDWFERHTDTSMPAIIMLALFIAVVSVVVTVFMVIDNRGLSRELNDIKQQKEQLNSDTYSQQLTKSRELIELKSSVDSLKNKNEMLERELNEKTNENRKLEKDQQTIKNNLNEQKNSVGQLENALAISKEQTQNAKQKINNLERELTKLTSDYTALNQQYSHVYQQSQEDLSQFVLKSIKPVWLEKTPYFNNRAVIALLAADQTKLTEFLNEQVEYVYYKIDSGKLTEPAEIISASTEHNKERGIYFIAYSDGGENWAGKLKTAVLKLKSETTERTITFY